MTQEDVDDIKAIALDIQQMASKANYTDNTFAEFTYDVDQAMKAILEIIEKPKFSIIKVISRDK